MRMTLLLPVAVIAGAFLKTAAHAEPFTGPSIGVEVAQDDLDSYDGTTTALVAGWDFVLDRDWRAGIGVRLTVADIDEQRSEPLGQNIQDIEARIENRVGVTGRVGRVIGEQWMAYAEASYEQYDVQAVRVLRAPFCVPPTGCVISRLDGSFDESMTSLGVGVEWATTENIRLRGAVSRGESDAFDRNRLAVSAAWQF